MKGRPLPLLSPKSQRGGLSGQGPMGSTFKQGEKPAFRRTSLCLEHWHGPAKCRMLTWTAETVPALDGGQTRRKLATSPMGDGRSSLLHHAAPVHPRAGPPAAPWPRPLPACPLRRTTGCPLTHGLTLPFPRQIVSTYCVLSVMLDPGTAMPAKQMEWCPKGLPPTERTSSYRCPDAGLPARLSHGGQQGDGTVQGRGGRTRTREQ